jgi:hypothetical protein
MTEALRELLDRLVANPGKTASAALLVPLLVVGLEVGEFKANAEDAHREAAELGKVVDRLVTIQEEKAREERIRAELAAERRRELARLCRAGELKNPATCRSVGVELR